MVLAVNSSSTAYQVGKVTGLLVALVVIAFVVRRAATRGFGRHPRRTRDLAIAAAATVLASAYLVSAISGGIFDSSSPSSRAAWGETQGIELRAGFIAGCDHGVGSRQPICECVFDHLTTEPRYGTPARFEALYVSMRRLASSTQTSEAPPGVLAAVRVCVTPAG